MVSIKRRSSQRSTLAGFAALVLAFGTPCSPLLADELSLLITTDGTAQIGSRILDDEEILLFKPGHPLPMTELLSHEAWGVLLGDLDRDGSLNDTPTEVDALIPLVDSSRGISVFDLALSFDTDRILLDGTLVSDGDIIRLNPDGTITFVYKEQRIAGALNTFQDVDIDGAALLPDGGLIFTLAQEVVTLSPALAAQNGNSPLLSDHIVFVLPVGANAARIRHTEAEIVALANNALGTSYASLIDVQGLEVDPTSSGDILFTTGIHTVLGASTVISTRNGGSIATVNGMPLTPELFGFAEGEDLNSLALIAAETLPLHLGVDSRTITPWFGEKVELKVRGGTPGRQGRILASELVGLHVPAREQDRLAGAGALFVDPASRLFQASVRSKRNRFTFDSTGSAALSLRVGSDLWNAKIILQAVEEGSRNVSYPVSVEFQGPSF